MIDQYITEHELSTRLQISRDKLRRMRKDGYGPNYIKVGGCVRYSETAVKHFLAERTFISTSEKHPRGSHANHYGALRQE